VAADKEAHDKLGEALALGDSYGVAELVSSGRVFEVKNGTRVLELGGFLSVKVRVLEGKYAGRIAWVPREFLRDEWEVQRDTQPWLLARPPTPSAEWNMKLSNLLEKTPAEVSAVLGRASYLSLDDKCRLATGKVVECGQAEYGGASLVDYLGGVSRRVWLQVPREMFKYPEDVKDLLQTLGLPTEISPSRQTDYGMWWDNNELGFYHFHVGSDKTRDNFYPPFFVEHVYVVAEERYDPSSVKNLSAPGYQKE